MGLVSVVCALHEFFFFAKHNKNTLLKTTEERLKKKKKIVRMKECPMSNRTECSLVFVMPRKIFSFMWFWLLLCDYRNENEI